MQFRGTVDRLDKPSAYFNKQHNKRRRTDNGDDDAPPPPPQEDPLANSTTLYVGNLYVLRPPVHLGTWPCSHIRPSY